MYNIETVAIELIDSNPHRDLKTYPWIENKIEQLQRSIDEVGFWAGVIARPAGKRFQMAFGHHRIEAVRRNNKLKKVPLIIDQMTDKQMLQFMGRENGEDYDSDFTVMLNTWEGAVRFLENTRGSVESDSKLSKPLDIAITLGWTRFRERDNLPMMSNVATACAAAFALINGGYQERQVYRHVSVKAAMEIATRAQELMRQTELMGRLNKVAREQIDTAKRHIGKAATKVADDYREGNIAKRDLRGQVDVNTYRYARDSGVKNTPLFIPFGNALVAQIERMVNVDPAAEKLTEVYKALPNLIETEDWQIVQKLDLALEQLGGRVSNWRKKLIPPNKKIVSLAVPPAGR